MEKMRAELTGSRETPDDEKKDKGKVDFGGAVDVKQTSTPDHMMFKDLYSMTHFPESGSGDDVMLGDTSVKLTLPFVKMAEAFIQLTVWEEVNAGRRCDGAHNVSCVVCIKCVSVYQCISVSVYSVYSV